VLRQSVPRTKHLIGRIRRISLMDSMRCGG
jgi:hypothetical protein